MSGANDGNDGEFEAFAWLRQSLGALPEALQETVSDLVSSSGGSWGGEANRGSAPAPESNFFDRLQNGVSDAWDKNPMEFLKVGLGAVGGAYTAAERRKQVEQMNAGRTAEQNNADALKQAEQGRYNASFSSAKRVPLAKRPLARLNGTQIYGNTGNIKG